MPVLLSEDKLNILVLHKLPPKNVRRSVVEELELIFPANAPKHNYIVHDGSCSLPDYIKNYNFPKNAAKVCSIKIH